MAFETAWTRRAEKFVRTFILERFSDKISYHNLDHTLDVVQASELIGCACGLSDEQLEIVLVAAWFHDVGYYLGNEEHEAISARIARDFLEKEGLPEDKIQMVECCIAATKVPQQPTNLVEMVLCDADLYHLSTERFFEKSDLLMRELMMRDSSLKSRQWMKASWQFVRDHTYHTAYGKKNLAPKKEANLRLLSQKLNKPKS
jgi:predicted metal-dependent HD superfamily phosphohydrolase